MADDAVGAVGEASGAGAASAGTAAATATAGAEQQPAQAADAQHDWGSDRATISDEARETEQGGRQAPDVAGAFKSEQPAAGGKGDYTVKSGDTLWDIAQHNGMDLQSLIAANPQFSDPSLIHPGETVHMPGSGAAGQPASAGWQAGPRDSGNAPPASPGEQPPADAQQPPPTPDAPQPPASNAQQPPAPQSPAPQSPAPQGGYVPSSSLVGTHGGQCVIFVQDQLGHHFPVDGAKEMLDEGKHDGFSVQSQPRPGDVFVRTGGQYGHTGFVQSVNSDGTITVIDSNHNYDEKVQVHTYAASDIQGYLRRS